MLTFGSLRIAAVSAALPASPCALLTMSNSSFKHRGEQETRHNGPRSSTPRRLGATQDYNLLCEACRLLNHLSEPELLELSPCPVQHQEPHQELGGGVGEQKEQGSWLMGFARQGPYGIRVPALTDKFGTTNDGPILSVS
jgi:hypothetical protein